MTRSEYLGVYTIPEEKREEGRAYRVALKIKDRKTNEFSWFNCPSTFASEEAAAHVYNVYAVTFFGKGAILNAVPKDHGRAEAGLYFLEKPNRTQTKLKMIDKFEALKAQNHVFKTHRDLLAEQAARRAADPQMEMVA